MAAKDLPACGLPEMGSGEGPSPPWFAFRGFLPPAQDDSGGAFVILSRRKLAFEQEHGGEGPSRGRPYRDGFRRRSFAAVVCAPWLLPPAQDDSPACDLPEMGSGEGPSPPCFALRRSSLRLRMTAPRRTFPCAFAQPYQSAARSFH